MLGQAAATQFSQRLRQRAVVAAVLLPRLEQQEVAAVAEVKHPQETPEALGTRHQQVHRKVAMVETEHLTMQVLEAAAARLVLASTE